MWFLILVMSLTVILTDKLARTQLDKSIILWVSNCLMGWAQRILLIGVRTGWHLGPVLFNIWTQESNGNSFNDFACHTKLGVTVNSFEGRELKREIRMG